MNYQYGPPGSLRSPTTMFFLLSPRLINFAEIVVAFMTLMGLQLLQGFAGAATPREGRWLLRHEGSSWEMDAICFGRVGLWTIHQRKMVPTRHRVIVVDMFWGVFSGRTNLVSSPSFPVSQLEQLIAVYPKKFLNSPGWCMELLNEIPSWARGIHGQGAWKV